MNAIAAVNIINAGPQQLGSSAIIAVRPDKTEVQFKRPWSPS
jgi:hypothetical protein